MSAPLPEFIGTWLAIGLAIAAGRGIARDWLFDRKRGRR